MRSLRGLRAFLNLEVGVTRDVAPIPRWKSRANTGDDRDSGGMRPENVVWIFGFGRTGSTWLSAIMDEMDDQTVWQEPLIGALFGNLYYIRAGHRVNKLGKHFILGDGYKDTWFGPMRDMVLSGATTRFPELANGGYLVVKEPNGSIGAPLLTEAMPESRVILLVRDPRDVVASHMDARKEGSWLNENRKAGRQGRTPPTTKSSDVQVKRHASAYLRDMGNARKAYEDHRGQKALVKYELLRGDTLGTMKRMYSSLGIAVDEDRLARSVEKQAWENISEDQKGEGKFYRKAKPGGWREDLTPKQIGMIEEITAPLLDEFYPEWKEAGASN